MKDFIYLIGILAVLFLVLFGLDKIQKYFDNQPHPRNLAYACPVDDSTKCYELPVDYERDCVEDHGCTSSVYKIYFPNGGHISLEYCDNNNDKKLRCYEEDSERAWDIQLTGEKTKEKYNVDGTIAE